MDRELILKLTYDFPFLKNEIESYINEYGAIYLHLIFGDIFNPYLLEILENPTKNDIFLVKAAGVLEDMSKMSDYIQEVVVTTVLERLLDEPNKFSVFENYLGDATKRLALDMK